MKKANAGKVPVLENAFEVNLPRLMRSAKKLGTDRLVLDDGDIRTVVQMTDTRLAIKLGGQVWVADIVPVSCLGGRLRPLLKCPRAHEGNFQALYYRTGELACRHCHDLRYRSKLAAGRIERAKLARNKLVERMGGDLGDAVPDRQVRSWRRRYRRLMARLASLTSEYRHGLMATLRAD